MPECTRRFPHWIKNIGANFRAGAKFRAAGRTLRELRL
jgi:hypothetical protein